MRRALHLSSLFVCITSSKSAAPLRVYKTTINLYFGVDVELAHVKSAAFNFYTCNVTFYAVLLCVQVSLRYRIDRRQELVHQRSIDPPLLSWTALRRYF